MRRQLKLGTTSGEELLELTVVDDASRADALGNPLHQVGPAITSINVTGKNE
jgi:hypothetical protein